MWELKKIKLNTHIDYYSLGGMEGIEGICILVIGEAGFGLLIMTNILISDVMMGKLDIVYRL